MKAKETVQKARVTMNRQPWMNDTIMNLYKKEKANRNKNLDKTLGEDKNR